jgi:hypothetical protein
VTAVVFSAKPEVVPRAGIDVMALRNIFDKFFCKKIDVVCSNYCYFCKICSVTLFF